MSEQAETPQEATSTPTSAPADEGISQGTYEILKDRLAEHSKTLRQRSDALNAQRLEVFGGTETTVIANERIRTENNCVPRDIISVGKYLLFGYNVFIGLKTEVKIDDVLSLHTFEEKDGAFEIGLLAVDHPDNFLHDSKFVTDFRELYKYYKETSLLQLRKVEGKILAIFQIGAQLTDIRVFRWAVDPTGKTTYIDNRGERDHVFPPSHDFEWTVTDHNDFVLGRHPHVSILDEVFVEAVGGDLTVKVEDNTEDGHGIYREPVDDLHQSLEDGEVHYAKVGVLILMRILPYTESVWRHLIFNTRNQQVDRVDAVGQACVQLPEDHGIIFPGGYYLQSGETKAFEGDVDDMELMRMIRSPNGEDVLYVFHERVAGRKILLLYNMIRKEVANPIHCNGYSLFSDGRLVVFRAMPEATRVHPMQVWETPFVSDEHAAATPTTGHPLEKIGNADLVRGISDAYSICRMVDEQEPSVATYEDLIAAAVRTADAYFWLDDDATGNLLEPLNQVRAAADLVVGEFEKVQTIKRQAREATEGAETALEELFNRIRTTEMRSIDAFVDALAELRSQRGHLVGLREMRYVDGAAVDGMEEKIIEQFDALSGRTVEFLLGEDALTPYQTQINEAVAAAEEIEKTTDAEPLRETLDSIGDGLELLTDILGTLKIDDPTKRTEILERISEVMATLNRSRAVLEAKRKELLSTEGTAEFAAQFNLFTQSVAGAIGIADTPEKCDEQLSKLMLQLEELEGRFGEFDEFLETLATKREEVYEAFSTKKQSLQDALQRRAQRMMQAAERILNGIKRRAAGFKTNDELNTYFVSDAMVAKVRDISKDMRELGDNVKADELDSRLKASREDAARALRDRQEIFEGGADVIKFGRHRFSVNTQPFDLTMVPWKDGMAYYLSGTDFHEPVDDTEFEETRELWDQLLISETPEVYRGEYLAAAMLFDAEEGKKDLSLDLLNEAAAKEAGEKGGLLDVVRKYAADRYEEGYERGLHDQDTVHILAAILPLYQRAELLRFAPRPRSLAVVFWSFYSEQMARVVWERRAQSLGRLRTAFDHSPAINELTDELGEAIHEFFGQLDIEIHPREAHLAGTYLFEELSHPPVSFVTSAEAMRLRDAFVRNLERANTLRAFNEDLGELQDNLPERYQLAHAWLTAFLEKGDEEIREMAPSLDEAVVLLLTEGRVDRTLSDVPSSTVAEGLLGQHPRVHERKMELRLDEYLGRLNAFRHDRVPAFRAFQDLRHKLLEGERKRLRLSEYMPKVMSAFVRNRLINEVYLPLIGDNLAKQMGALGDNKRTDQMGLLLLISPPGYGKTTLMEYIANRLGLIFVKVNGPALGHNVTSIDPSEAPNATARQEVEKINFALEMANNVLLYLDDIQHTHPELLQKFISLCDAQRRIEGVWKDETKTYDLKGKRFAICMAGNPYTEAGEKFQIPDMLANRADTYNLGDILEGKGDVFALSYLENSLTSNPVLAPLTTREPKDVYLLIRMAQGEEVQADQLSHGYSQVELEEILDIFRKLLRVQQVLLSVNQQYIYSAAQDDAFRTEPRFQLQGSYRNMNKLTEKIVAVMNDEELESLIDDHYIGEAQTLTTGAEHNMLKLKELRGTLKGEEAERWEEIKRGFARRQVMGDSDEDPAVRMVGQMALLSDRLQDIGRSITSATEETPDFGEGLGTALVPYLEKLHGNLGALSKIAQIQTQAAQNAANAQAPANGGTQAAAQDGPGMEVFAEQLATGFDRMAERLGEVLTKMPSAPAAVPQAAAQATAGPPAAAPPSDLGPFLGKLTETMQALAEAPRGAEVVQSLDPGVYDVLETMHDRVGDRLLPMVKEIGRRIKGSPLEQDRRLRDQLDRTLRDLDSMKDLLSSLRKIDTRRLSGGA